MLVRLLNERKVTRFNLNVLLLIRDLTAVFQLTYIYKEKLIDCYNIYTVNDGIEFCIVNIYYKIVVFKEIFATRNIPLTSDFHDNNPVVSMKIEVPLLKTSF